MSREFPNEQIPLGYLITFRSYGSWLHGDRRGSVDRFHNRFGTPRIPHNEAMNFNGRALKNAVTSSSTRHPSFETPSSQERWFDNPGLATFL
jgi:hypothetical protein